MKTRAVWFVTGAVAGVAGTTVVKRKVAAAADRLRPTNVAAAGRRAVRRGRHRVIDAVKEGVVTARRRERELVAERDGRLVRLSDHLAPGDELVVDGEVVESARVLLLRQRDDGASL
jgi:hypothetical protein